jgi:hypothetical protein
MTKRSAGALSAEGDGVVVPVLSATLGAGDVVPVLGHVVPVLKNAEVGAAAAVPVLDPGARHATVFQFGADKTSFTTFKRKGGGKAADEKDSGASGSGAGSSDWNRRVPGLIAPGRAAVLHSFHTIDELEGAVPQLAAAARQASLPGREPASLVLSVHHRGPLDPMRIARIGQSLTGAGVDTRIVVAHDDTRDARAK